VERELELSRIEIVDDATAEMYRSMPAAQRVNVACDLVEFAWELVKSGVRARHPEWNESSVQREADRRFRLPSA
jgi:hypothetical protein